MELVAEPFDDRQVRETTIPDVVPAPEATPGPKYLSPSSAGTYKQCPKRWKFRYVDRLPDPPGEAALAGTFAHRVLELLMQEPPENRTITRAKELARIAWPETAEDDDFKALALEPDDERRFRWRGWVAIEGLWKLENPSDVEVHATEQDIQISIGGVPFRGIIDRVDASPDGLLVSDYKSGQAPGDRWSAERLDQVLLYAAALRELTGTKPVKAQLLYLGQKVVDVEVDDDNLAAVIDDLQRTWASLQRDLERQEFEPQTGPLCGWCPFIAGCPEGAAEVTKRNDAGRMRADAPALRLVANAS